MDELTRQTPSSTRKSSLSVVKLSIVGHSSFPIPDEDGRVLFVLHLFHRWFADLSCVHWAVLLADQAVYRGACHLLQVVRPPSHLPHYSLYLYRDIFSLFFIPLYFFAFMRQGGGYSKVTFLDVLPPHSSEFHSWFSLIKVFVLIHSIFIVWPRT